MDESVAKNPSHSAKRRIKDTCKMFDVSESTVKRAMNKTIDISRLRKASPRHPRIPLMWGLHQEVKEDE